MAIPITSIKKNEQTAEQVKQKKLAELQSLIAKQDEAIHKILEVTGELDEIGLFDALHAIVKAREDIARIAVDQLSREPVTHLINHLLHLSSALSTIDPEVTNKLATSLKVGIEEAELSKTFQKVSIFQLMTALNDPDINRAITFGLNFLKGIGKGIEEKKSE